MSRIGWMQKNLKNVVPGEWLYSKGNISQMHKVQRIVQLRGKNVKIEFTDGLFLRDNGDTKVYVASNIRNLASS